MWASQARSPRPADRVSRPARYKLRDLLVFSAHHFTPGLADLGGGVLAFAHALHGTGAGDPDVFGVPARCSLVQCTAVGERRAKSPRCDHPSVLLPSLPIPTRCFARFRALFRSLACRSNSCRCERGSHAEMAQRQPHLTAKASERESVWGHGPPPAPVRWITTTRYYLMRSRDSVPSYVQHSTYRGPPLDRSNVLATERSNASHDGCRPGEHT